MKGAFTCPYCFTQNACDCETCKPFIKEGEYVNKWDKTGNYHICGKCGKTYSPDQSLDAEFKLNKKEMTKPFIVANVREIIDQFDKEEISFSKMVELLNEKAAEYYRTKQETNSLETIEDMESVLQQELAKERERAAMLVDMLLMILEGYLNPEYDRIMINKIIQTISEYRNQPETTGNQTAC